MIHSSGCICELVIPLLFHNPSWIQDSLIDTENTVLHFLPYIVLVVLLL